MYYIVELSDDNVRMVDMMVKRGCAIASLRAFLKRSVDGCEYFAVKGKWDSEKQFKRDFYTGNVKNINLEI